jgi:hypothetical protein
MERAHAQDAATEAMEFLSTCGSGLVSVATGMSGAITALLSGCPRCAMVQGCESMRLRGMDTIMSACVEAPTGMDFGDLVSAGRMIYSALGEVGAGNMGVAMSVGGAAGATVGMGFEVACIGNRLQAYCAPSLGVASDVGAGAQVMGMFRTLGCRRTDNYSGGFLNMNVSASVLDMGIPLPGVSVSLNMGIGLNDTASFPAHVAGYIRDHPTVLAGMVVEMANAESILTNTLGRELTPLITLLLAQVANTNIGDPSSIRASLERLRTTIAAQLRTSGLTDTSRVARILTRLPNTSVKTLLEGAAPLLGRAGFPALSQFLQFMAGEMSGCDALGPGLGVGRSLMPVAGGLGLSEYTLAGETLDLTGVGLSCASLIDGAHVIDQLEGVMSGRVSCDETVAAESLQAMERLMGLTRWLSSIVTQGCNALGAADTLRRAYTGGTCATLPRGMAAMVGCSGR